MTMLQDFRYALRTIRQAPGFSAVVTLTIALGVGATTAMFSVVDAVLLRPLPYPAQGSLVKLFDTQRGRDVAALSFPEFIDWRDRSTTHGLHMRPLAAVLVGDLAAPLALLLTAVALLLLIACGNVANLLLARSASLGREFAVRTALGADRGRLVSLVMVESVIRAAVGGLFGIGLAYAMVNVARTMLVGTIPRVATAGLRGVT